MTSHDSSVGETRDSVVSTRIPIESQSSPAFVDATTARDPDQPRDERVFFSPRESVEESRRDASRRVESRGRAGPVRVDADSASDSMSSRDAASSGTLARVLRQMHSLDKGAADDPRARAI